jgi:Flp pilus assembly protein TadB
VNGYFNWTPRIIASLIFLAFVLGLLLFGCSQWEKRKNAAAQGRVERSQAEAASNSAADAIGTVTVAGGREAASEALTRDNEKAIRNAEGANERVGAGVNAAGLRSLCKRAAYRDHPRCRVQRASPE